jgi:hypothetical protein
MLELNNINYLLGFIVIVYSSNHLTPGQQIYTIWNWNTFNKVMVVVTNEMWNLDLNTWFLGKLFC